MPATTESDSGRLKPLTPGVFLHASPSSPNDGQSQYTSVLTAVAVLFVALVFLVAAAVQFVRRNHRAQRRQASNQLSTVPDSTPSAGAWELNDAAQAAAQLSTAPARGNKKLSSSAAKAEEALNNFLVDDPDEFAPPFTPSEEGVRSPS